MISAHPATQQVPIPRATTAACEVMPPRAVSIPLALCIPSISSGDVSVRTKITFFPALAFSKATGAEKTISPTAAPGEAGNPEVIGSALAKAFWSNCLCNKLFNSIGSIRSKASSLVINFSLTKSTATRTAEAIVLFPFLVCKIYKTPLSIVNSISCISL